MKVFKISPLGITLFEEERYDRTNSHSSDLFVNVPTNWESRCEKIFEENFYVSDYFQNSGTECGITLKGIVCAEIVLNCFRRGWNGRFLVL